MRRRVLIAASAALLIAVAGDVALQRLVGPRVMATLSRLADAPTTAARLRISPLGTIRISDLRAGQRLTARDLEMTVDLGSLLDGDPRPARIVARGVRLRLGGGPKPITGGGQPRDSTWWRSSANHVLSAGPLEATVNDLEVVDERRGVTAWLERLNVQARSGVVWVATRGLAVQQGALRIEATGAQLSALAPVKPPLHVTLSGGRVLVEGRPLVEDSVTTLRLDAGGGELRSVGRAPVNAKPSGRPAPHLSISVRFGQDGGEGRLQSDAFPLGPLAPLARRLGLITEHATLESELAARWHGSLKAGTEVGASGRLIARHLVVEHPRLAARRVTLPQATLDGSARLRGDTVEVDRASLQVGPVETTVRFSLSRLSRAPLLSLYVTLSEVACQDLVTAIPPGLAPALRGLTLKGRLSASGSLHIDWSNLGKLRHDGTIGAHACRVVHDAPGANVLALKGTFTHVVRDAAGEPRELPLGPPNPHFRPLAGISRHVVSAFLTAEDRLFWSHEGFDVEMLGRALGHDLAAGRIEKGASTITQQLAKNLFLAPDRTIGRKLEEAVIAWRLEQVLSKRRILELYLNAIELGPGIYGVQEAAHQYFQKDPARLTPLEAAHLAALAPNPRLFAQRVASGPDARQRWRRHLGELLAMMRRANRITASEARAAQAQELQLRSVDGATGHRPRAR